MNNSTSAFEIELKALLTKEQFQNLWEELPKKMTLINEDTIYTQGYKPGDIQLRHSEKSIKIVCKEEDPTKLCRKEVVVPLQSLEELDKFKQIFVMIGLKPSVPWTKHKRDFKTKYKNFTYEVSLQHIENFAYILEVEFMSDKEDSHIHENNIKEIIRSLGAEPINPEDFKKKINEYQKDNYF
jgi:adenylate cyclase class IV